jgi:hypothetical protein
VGFATSEFHVLTFYHCNPRTVVLVLVRLYFMYPEEGASALKDVGVILCNL